MKTTRQKQNARILARKLRALAHAEKQISRMAWGTQPREVASQDRRSTTWYKCGNLKMLVNSIRNSR